MYAPPDHWPGEPRYHARLEVHLDAGTQTKITRFVTAFRRPRSQVIRQVLQWGLTHGQGWQVDRGRRPAPHHSFLRLEPEVRQQVEAAARASGGDISAWLRHAVHLITVADFPASWQAASAEQGRAPQRERDSRTYHERFMLRLDDALRGKLDEFTRFFVTSRAEVIRQLNMQATPKVFPKSWHLAAEERRQRHAGQVDTSKTRRS